MVKRSSSESLDVFIQSLDEAVLLMEDRMVSCNWSPLMRANTMELCTLLYLSCAGHLMNRPTHPTGKKGLQEYHENLSSW